MAYSRIKVWIAAEILTASDLNAEHTGHINNENDLDTRLVAEVSARTTLEGEHDTLQTNLWNSTDSQVADNKVGQDSMKDSSVHTAELKAGAVTGDKCSAGIKDAVAANYSLRRLGTTSLKACAGDDTRLRHRSTDFASNGTFTASTTLVIIYLASGGGGGGGGDSDTATHYGGGGGGAGAYREYRCATVAGTEYAVTIGAGGTGGAGGNAGGAGSNGNNGGTTTVAGLVTEGGGTGGAGANSTGGAGGAGNTAGGYPGKSGGIGNDGTSGGTGAGGAGGVPFELMGTGGASGGTAANGGSGSGYGGGGGGGGGADSFGQAGAGGAGKAGFVRIVW